MPTDLPTRSHCSSFDHNSDNLCDRVVILQQSDENYCPNMTNKIILQIEKNIKKQRIKLKGIKK